MQGGQSGRLINQQSTWELNLTVLQRHDENIQEILFTAAHVTLYDFDVDKCQWSRKDVEGSLFVVKRRTTPRFQFIVMNRRSTTNLVEDVLDGFECEVQVPYLLYRNAADEVNGIWFYNARECEEVASLFARISSAYSKTPQKQIFSPSRNDFTELESVPASAVVEELLEPTAASTSPAGALKDSLERFFIDVPNLNSHQPPITPAATRTSAANFTSPVHAAVDLTGSYTPGHIAPTTPAPAPSPPLPPPTSRLGRESAIPISEALLKPHYYVPPPLPASQAPTIHHPVLQPSVGAPLLQPFPPPTSFSLAASSPSTARLNISKEGVRDALLRVVQKDAFVDMVFEEMMRAHR